MQTLKNNGSHQILKYRKDIDSLRAFAILLVLSYHFFPKTFKSGFIGVDIFFTISGFLISSIIFKEIHNNSFLFLEFYKRRIRRIFPCLLLVIFSTYIFGFLFLFRTEFFSLNRHILGATTFSSNFLLLNEAGYFDLASLHKPLIHLWSLAIEEQFYIFMPLCLFLLAKFSSKNFLIFLIFFTLLSLILNAFQVFSNKSEWAFYFPLSRAFEFLIGTISAYLVIYKSRLIDSLNRNFFSLLGALLLGASIFVITGNDNFPGFYVLLPTIGAAFVIIGGPHSFLGRSILSNKLLIFIGLISYPLYLWHYPILSFTFILKNGVVSIVDKLLILIASLILATFTYFLIEKPIKKGQSLTFITNLLLFLMAIIFSISLSIIFLPGIIKGENLFVNSTRNNTSSIFTLYQNKIIQARNEFPNFSHKTFTEPYERIVWAGRSNVLRSGVCDLGSKQAYLDRSSICDLVDETKKNIIVLGDSGAADAWGIFSKA